MCNYCVSWQVQVLFGFLINITINRKTDNYLTYFVSIPQTGKTETLEKKYILKDISHIFTLKFKYMILYTLHWLEWCPERNRLEREIDGPSFSGEKRGKTQFFAQFFRYFANFCKHFWL